MKRIHVMAAVIRDTKGRILLAKRPDHAHQGGLWEFPGGKRDPGESRLEALRRELQEELGISLQQARPLIDIRHDYPDKSIRLDVWQVDAFDGQAHGAEGQLVRWVSAAELGQYEFPKANHPILQAVRLPHSYLITPDLESFEQIEAGIERALASGVSLIQLRQTQLDRQRYHDLALRVAERCKGRADLLLKGEQHPTIPGAGWHLTARQLMALDESGATLERDREAREIRLYAASCHNPEELAAAKRVGVDFVTLSPLMPTASHPGAETLGWERAALWLQDTNLPAFLLGGLGPADLGKAWEGGAQGVAAITGLWPTADR